MNIKIYNFIRKNIRYILGIRPNESYEDGLERIYWSSTAFTGFGSNHSYYIAFYAVKSNGIEARSNKYPVRLVRTF